MKALKRKIKEEEYPSKKQKKRISRGAGNLRGQASGPL